MRGLERLEDGLVEGAVLDVATVGDHAREVVTASGRLARRARRLWRCLAGGQCERCDSEGADGAWDARA
ncbi:hypothetical protein ACFPRL_11890 [Pseudoclavibacter helvolus]